MRRLTAIWVHAAQPGFVYPLASCVVARRLAASYGHAIEIKPKTLQDYHLINRHVRPHIGDLRLQAITPPRITKLCRDLFTTGSRNGTGLSPRTVAYVHAVLRKAFREAVVVEQVLPSNPVERGVRPVRCSPYPQVRVHRMSGSERAYPGRSGQSVRDV